jgi:hypothetical protein
VDKNRLMLETSNRAIDTNDECSIINLQNSLDREVRANAQSRKLSIHEPRENEAIDVHVVTERIHAIMATWDVYKTENPVVIDVTPAESNWFDETTIVIHGRHFGGNEKQRIRVVVGDKECSSVRIIKEGSQIECKVPPGSRGTNGKVIVYVNGQRSKENVIYHWGINTGMPSWMETTDSLRGLRQSTSHPQLWYAVSRSNVWDKQMDYRPPKGFQWATTDDGLAILGGSTSNSTAFVYYNQGGWDRYTWAGKERYYFRFADSAVTNAAKHAGTADPAPITYNSDTDNFAGIVLLKKSS